MSDCLQCAGCGKIANDDEGTPWKYWLELPLHSSIAVLVGIVRPIECPACHGIGQIAAAEKPKA